MFRVIKDDGKAVHTGNMRRQHCKKEYVCQSEADISTLPKVGIPGTQTGIGFEHDNEPCAFGSTAIVTKDGSVYILGPDNTWAKIG